jgi:O-acetyl-ADP-ribose deacetylase (regulator of RNase III)
MKHVQGDLLKMADEGQFDYIFHGCNCFALMGDGIARSIAKKYPEAEASDRENSTRGDISKLGDYTTATVQDANGENFVIVNLYTQFQPGAHFEYQALRSALDLFLGDQTFPADKVIRLGFPLIGAGIGGGDWDYIETIIGEALSYLGDRVDVTIVEFVP